MEYANFPSPPYPHFIIAGDALYRPGDIHRKRACIGIFDLVYVEYGELFITDGDHAYHLKENDVLIIRPDTIHYGHKPCSVKTKFMWCHFRTSGTYYYSEEIQLPSPNHSSIYSYEDRTSLLILPLYKRLSPQEAVEFSVCFSSLMSSNIDKYQQKEQQGQTYLSPLECQETFLRLLNFLQVMPSQFSPSELLAASIIEYISRHYPDPISLKDIADYFNFHPVHIIRCLKREYGITPNKALTGIRIEHAKRMLVTSNLSINKISYYVGFTTISYFNRTFKEHTGMTPREFRRQQGTV